MTNGPLIDGIEHLPDVPLAIWVRFQLGTRHFDRQGHHFAHPNRPENDAAAILAIEACADGEEDRQITLWNGRVLPASEVVEDLHLWPLVELLAEDPLAEAKAEQAAEERYAQEED